MHVLVTGPSGSVGKYVVQELEGTHRLRLFSRRHPREGKHKFETAHPFLAGDLTDAAALARAVEGVDAVAHLGANPWISEDTFRTNVMSVYLLLEACRVAGVRRFVMAGSDWGVAKSLDGGRPDFVPVTEDHPCRPADNYGLSKVVGERIVETYARLHGIRSAVLRITGVWMPETTAGYAAKDRTKAAAENAQWWWSYVDVRDVARAFRMALEAPDLPAFGTYFLSAADTVVDEPTREAVRTHWPDVPVRGELPGHRSVLSWEAARRGFGWEPQHSWRSKPA